MTEEGGKRVRSKRRLGEGKCGWNNNIRRWKEGEEVETIERRKMRGGGRKARRKRRLERRKIKGGITRKRGERGGVVAMTNERRGNEQEA